MQPPCGSAGRPAHQPDDHHPNPPDYAESPGWVDWTAAEWAEIVDALSGDNPALELSGLEPEPGTLLSAAMQPSSRSPDISAAQSDRYQHVRVPERRESMYASIPKALPADSSAVQPAHQLSDANGETTTGDGRSPLEAQVSPRGLVTVMQQRYHTPRHPKSVGRSQTRQRAWRNSATASGRNSFDSAEQPVPSREAASSVPRHSSDSDTGFGQYNPQSGDFELCHRAKPPPPVFKAPAPKEHHHLRVAAFKAPPPNSSLALSYGGFYNPTSFLHGHNASHEGGHPARNPQGPNLPSKAPPIGVPRRYALFLIPSPD